MKFVSLLVFLLTLFQLSFGQSHYGIPSKNESWLDGWTYRRPITIDNTSNPSGLITYQVFIESDSFNYDETKDDAADLRFTASDGQNLLSYWIEEWDTTGTSIVWVKLTIIPASGTATIYMYYGNDTATAVSNGVNTFNLFENFGRYIDTSTKWTLSSSVGAACFAGVQQTLSNVVANGELEGICTDGSYYYVGNYLTSSSTLDKVALDGTHIDNVTISEEELKAVGGIDYYGGYVWVSVYEHTENPSNPTKIKRYLPDLTYVDTPITIENESIGGICIAGQLDRIYLANWGTDSIYVYKLSDFSFVTVIDYPPQYDIQDFVYADTLILGSVQPLPRSDICVLDPSADGNSLTKVADVMTPPDMTYNGLTWYDGNFICAWGDNGTQGDIYIMQDWDSLDGVILKGNNYMRSKALLSQPQILEGYYKMGDDPYTDDNRCHNFGLSSYWPVYDTTMQVILHHQDDPQYGSAKLFEGDTHSDGALYIEEGDWIRWRLTWLSDTAYLCKNRDADSVISLFESDIPEGNVYLGLQTWGSMDDSVNVKWLFTRDYTAIEPTVSIGAEEEQGGEPPEPGVDARNAMNRYGLAPGWGVYRW